MATNRHIQFDESLQMWIIAGYKEARTLLSKQSNLSSAEAYTPRSAAHMAASDGADHRRRRSSFFKFFERIERMRPAVSAIARELTEQLLEQQTPVDLVERFSRPLALRTMLRMIGLSQGDELIVPACLSAWGRVAFGTPQPKDHDLIYHLTFAVQNAISTAHGTHDDNIANCAAIAVKKNSLTEREATESVCHILAAGVDTTSAAMNNLLFHALRRSDRRSQFLASDAAATAFVEESLRCNSSVRGPIRRAIYSQKVGGVTIQPGDLIYFDVVSANRDESQFLRPDVFDPSRPSLQQHLSFGWGEHYCLGASLARLELCIGLKTILNAAPSLRLSRENPIVIQKGGGGPLIESLKAEF